ARLSHHPADAVAPLSRLLREHATDPRAPLAAFTLGRVLLDELGRPREAAQSFLRVQELDPDGPLSQDALAREVEAWSRAGEQGVAHSRAEEYVRRYPTGRRLRSVRRYGDLD
ncbi:MAG TPA: tetratricopeptide repeat protein, partial [Pseudomonadota bacterium]|nr:tetratricopeptide repeat protein [Pseudomonadota bacterium]